LNTWRAVLNRLRHLVRQERFDRSLNGELQFHIESRIEELEQQGYARTDARARAVQEFGSRARIMEDTRAAWQWRWLLDVKADVAYAMRAFRRRPAFAATATACLALGIGANALIFSLVNTVLLRPLPYPDADRIVMLRFTPPNQPDQKLGTNRGTFRFLREHSQSFEHIGELRAIDYSIAAGSSGDAGREWVLGGWTGPGVTRVMGVEPMLGRWFAATDTDFGVVVSHGVWQRLFGGSPDVLGQTLRLDTIPSRVIGVLPPGYRTLNPDIQVWRLQPDNDGALRSPNRVFNIFARLKPGVTIAQAQAEMNMLAGPLGEYMEMHRGWGIAVDSLRDAYVGHLKRPILVLQGAVLLLLCIACSNVAGLLLAQAVARQKELGLRSALGSTRSRIVRQLLTENVLLSCGAGVLGLALASLGLRALVNTGLSAYRDLQSATLDWTVLGFGIAVSLATALVFGILPALQLSRTDVRDTIRDAGRTIADAAPQGLRGAFVVAQVALAFVLLVGTGLLVRSLVRLNAVDSGLDPKGLVTLQLPFPRSLYGAGTSANTPAGGLLVQFDSRWSDLTERTRERLAAVPGVQSVAATTPAPLGGEARRVLFTKAGGPAGALEREPRSSEWYAVSPDYFETLRVPLVNGRTFTRLDIRASPPVAIVNASMAARYWPGENPIGRLIETDVLDDPPREIVGVVGDVRQDRYQSTPSPQLYVPRSQLPFRMDMTMSLELLVTTFVVRAEGNPIALVPVLRAAITEVNPSLPVSSVRTVEEYAAAQLQELRQYAAVLGLFGALSVTLAVVGLVGVMAQTVGYRAHEIAIRLALGAQTRSVLHLLLAQGLRLIGAGLAAGLIISVLATPAIRSFLWGVTPVDPVTFALAVAGVAVLGAAACYVPVRKALDVSPIAALRNE
jgi:putative ABC transport system permease protein